VICFAALFVAARVSRIRNAGMHWATPYPAIFTVLERTAISGTEENAHRRERRVAPSPQAPVRPHRCQRLKAGTSLNHHSD